MPDQSKSVYSTLWDFVKCPLKDVLSTSTFTEKLKIFIPIFLLDILLALCCAIVILGLAKLNLITSESHKVVRFYNDGPVWIVLIVTVFFAPFIEELIFRFHLRLNEKKIQINFIILLSGIILILISVLKIKYIQISILALGIILLSIYYLREAKFNQFILSVWNRNYFFVFYVSTIGFGLLHITNFNPKLITYLLLPILILPQLLLGLFCGFIRLSIGFKWGYIFHASHNFIFIIPILLTALNPISYDKSVKIIEKSNSSAIKFWRITNDTIEFDRVKISDIIPKLANIEKEYIEFEDSTIAEKIITLNYARGKEKSQGELKSSCSIVLFELLRKYNLKMEQKSFEKDIYQLQVIDSVKLNLFNMSKVDTLKTLTFPIFYDNEITLHNADLKLIAKTIDLNFNKKVISPSNNLNKFTIMIPRLKFEELKQFLSAHYGIKLDKSIGKVFGFKISSRNNDIKK